MSWLLYDIAQHMRKALWTAILINWNGCIILYKALPRMAFKYLPSNNILSLNIQPKRAKKNIFIDCPVMELPFHVDPFLGDTESILFHVESEWSMGWPFIIIIWFLFYFILIEFWLGFVGWLKDLRKTVFYYFLGCKLPEDLWYRNP